MRFWLFIFILFLGAWAYYVIKPHIMSSGKKFKERMRRNVREELKGTFWKTKDGTIGELHDVEDNGRTFVLKTANGKIVRASYLDLERYTPERAEDIVKEVR
jgi:hypothetical protein